VDKYGKERFNNNNHWENGTPPSDYQEVCDSANANYWMDKFQDFYYVINLRKIDLLWLNEADNIGRHTMTFPKMFQDEMEALLAKYSYVDKIFAAEPKGLFVRTDRVSLKNGAHGAGPYTSLKMVIESLVTCIVSHTPMKNSETEEDLKLYFLPWRNIHTDAEFRVFIHNNKITGISQQHLYYSNKTLTAMDSKQADITIKKWANIILREFDDNIKRKITHTADYVMDIAVLNPLDDSPQPYFIEMNPFGTRYSSGSSLFCWLRDNEQLYGDGSVVEVRYTVDKEEEED